MVCSLVADAGRRHRVFVLPPPFPRCQQPRVHDRSKD